MNRTYHICTFGCQMNVNDSLWLEGALEARGFLPAPIDNADLICVNTCSVREKPEQKVKSTVERVDAETKGNPHVLIAILGCVAKQLGALCESFSPKVRLVCAPDNIHRVPDLIEDLLAHPRKKIVCTDATEAFVERDEDLVTHVPPQAYVNIMQGCDNFCTYCIVPYTRGRQRSRDPLAILAECRAKIARGAKELILLGQNVNAYGKDKTSTHGYTFARLLDEIARLPHLARLRYTSPHPKDMTAEDIAAFREYPSLCPSLHLPLQSGSSRVLRAMARGYDRERYQHLVEALYEACPDLALTTDIIVGFPGETEEDLEETLSLMEYCHFSSSYSFCYSDRPGTRAAGYTNKIPHEVAQARLERVQALQEDLTQRYLATRVGTTTSILVEGRSKRQRHGDTASGCSWEGRDPYGSKIHVLLPDTLEHRGELLPVTIHEQGKHCLFGTKPPHSNQQNVAVQVRSHG